MRSTYPNHTVLRVITENTHECGITLAVLLQWSSSVKTKFENDNMEANLREGESLMPVLLERIIILEERVRSSQEVFISNSSSASLFFL